jgi:hypothetical protein
MTPRRRPFPRLSALPLAIGAHLLALLALGWRIPRAPAPAAPDTLPPVAVQLLQPAPAGPAAPKASPSRARPSPGRPNPAQIPPSPAPVAAAPTPQVAEGPPDCAPEDLPLLTDAEKARCRNAVDADQARRLARGADERAARLVAEAQRMPQTFRMSTEKQAYYGAVADAYGQQSHGPPMAGHTVGVGCSIKFSGLAIVKTRPPPNSLRLGPCFLAPPQGFLTEESRIAPP